jgi:hypothetical protein
VNLKKIVVSILGLGLAFNAFSAELTCEEVRDSGRVEKATVIIDKDKRKIIISQGSDFGIKYPNIECYIYRIDEAAYFSRCPATFLPERPGKEVRTVTVNRKTLDTDFRNGLEEGQTYNFKCKLSEAKI